MFLATLQKKPGIFRTDLTQLLVGADLDDLSSQYFSLIPHDFGPGP